MTLGTITELRPGGFGFIASDALTMPVKLQFRREAVAGDGFDRLREGQRVQFERVPLPGGPTKFRAVRVSPVSDLDGGSPSSETNTATPARIGVQGAASAMGAEPETLALGHRMRLDAGDFLQPTLR